jgi:hypothetical protein
VHEATHGLLHSRDIPYTAENRTRIETFCVAEESRFARHLQVDPRVLVWLQPKFQFDPARWHQDWSATRWQKFFRGLSRIRARQRGEESR